MSLFNSYGRVYEIDPNVKGYTRLTISTNIPFKNRLIKFNIWESLLLKKPSLIPFKVGEEVRVDYSYKNGYPQLVSMIPSRVDNCPVCYTSLEGIDAQRLECDGCRLMPEEEHKKRINTHMQLVSKTLKDYPNCKGFRLELYNAVDNKAFIPVIFANNRLYNAIENLKVGNMYYVVGWLAPNGKYLDVVDIGTVLDSKF